MNQLALEVLEHAVAFSEEEPGLALLKVRRILYTEGLEGILQGAPEDLLRRVASTTPQERLLLSLYGALREPAAVADSLFSSLSYFTSSKEFPHGR